MRTIIVDDDVFFCKLINSFCEKAKVDVDKIFHNPIDALVYLGDNEVDLVFLDVHMPDINGFDFLKSSPGTKVILTTTDDSKAVEAFDYDVVDFLLKPVTFTRFLRSIQRFKKQLSDAKPKVSKSIQAKPEEENEEHIYVNINKRLIKVLFEDVGYIQAKGNYVLISRLKEENLIVHTTMKKISANLPSQIFQKVHRSYIVNVQKIVDIEDSSIVIGRNVIPIGKDYRNDLMNKLNLLK